MPGNDPLELAADAPLTDEAAGYVGDLGGEHAVRLPP
jgi:hypothetical protein